MWEFFLFTVAVCELLGDFCGTLYPWDRRVVLGAGVTEVADAECNSAIPG
jgi:hypothetical protein